jgi:hypothetical protein
VPALETAATLLARGFWMAACLYAAASLLFAFRYQITAPYGDHWVWLDRYYSDGLLSAAWRPFNEHRMFFPALLCAADQVFFAGSNRFLGIVELLSVAGCIWILLAGFRRQAGVSAAASAVARGFCLVWLVWYVQGINLFWAFQVPMVLCNLGLLASFYSFATYLYRDPPRRRLLIAALGLAVLATFSFGHGLVVWPILFFLALAGGARRRDLLLLAAVSAAVLVVFFVGYPWGQPWRSFGDPLKMVRFFLLFVGIPWFQGETGHLGVLRLGLRYSLAGFAALGAVFLAARACLRRERQPLDPGMAVCLAATLAVLGAAALATVNRSTGPLTWALTDRYGALSVTFWAALALLLTVELARWRKRPVTILRTGWCILLVVLAAATVPSQFDHARGWIEKDARVDVAVASLLAGVPERAFVEYEIWLDINQVRDVSRRLKQKHRAFYAGDRYALLNRPLESSFRPGPPEACAGAVSSVQHYPSIDAARGLQITGWVRESRSAGPVHWIVIADRDGVVRGLGSTLRRMGRHGVIPEAIRNSDSAWLAFAPASAEPFTAFAVLSDRRTLCALGGRQNPARGIQP